ncbi:hypothetical protein MIDIC_240062 [Alphaproteobacteria bacterium]
MSLIQKIFQFKKNDSGEIFGGIQAFFHKESIYIDVLWVHENLRERIQQEIASCSIARGH